jgi:hypothetical protein
LIKNLKKIRTSKVFFKLIRTSKVTKMEDDHNIKIISQIRTSKIRTLKRTSKVKNCQVTLLMFWPFLTPKVISQHPKYLPKKRLLTFWNYLWRQKRSERQKSNILWLLTFFSMKWFLTFWKYLWHSDLFDFRRYDHPKKTFDVLTLWCSDFQCSDPLS